MSTTPSSIPDDATLVAWLDGEASNAERVAIERALVSDETVRRKVALLRAARSDLAAALAVGDAPQVAATAPHRRLLLRLAAAAALLVVVVLNVLDRSPRVAPAAQNDHLEFRVLPVRGGWPIFAGIQFDLEGRSKTATPCSIVARNPGENDELLAARVAADPDRHAFLPLVLDAEVIGPDGQSRRGPVARVQGQFGRQATRLRIELVDIVLPHPAISPFVTVRMEETRWAEDFFWAFAHVGGATLGGDRGCVPEDVGEYRIRFSLRSFVPAGDARFPTFAEPLVAEATFSTAGVVGTWSDAQDGLRARTVGSSQRLVAGEPFAIALQLRNDSDRPRAYNVVGSTLAPVPQPFHFDLIVDGERWTQRDDLAVIMSGESGFLPQPAGTMRSVVVLSDYWQRDGAKLSDLVGRHTIALHFHFVPTLWSGGDELWQGQIETPPVTVEIGKRR